MYTQKSAPSPSPGCDFKQKENKAKTKMLRAKYLSCSCSFDKHPPLGSCLPAPATALPVRSQKWLLNRSGSQLGADFARQGTFGNGWRRF